MTSNDDANANEKANMNTSANTTAKTSMADAGENTPNTNGNGMLMFQTDGQWWFVWETEGGRQDAYTVSDDLGDLEMPHTSIVEDVFRRWYGGVAQTYVVVDRGVKIAEDGWPDHPAWSADARRKVGDRC